MILLTFPGGTQASSSCTTMRTDYIKGHAHLVLGDSTTYRWEFIVRAEVVNRA